MSVKKAEVKRVIKLCRQVQDQLNKARFALKGEGGTADLTEINNAIDNLEARITQLESYHAETIGIEQLSSGLRVGKWQSVDNNSNNLNGDASEVTSGDYIGIEQTATGETFGAWQFVEGTSGDSGSSSADVTELQTTVATLTTALEKALLRIEQLEGYHAEIVGVEQLKAGLRVGRWQSVDAEGNNLNSDTEEYDEVIVQKIETVGIEQLTSGAGFGTWKQVA